jgi:hypothetical protein
MSEIKTEISDEFSSGVLLSIPKRVRLPEDIELLVKESWLGLWSDQDLYIDHLENLIRESELKSVNVTLK